MGSLIAVLATLAGAVTAGLMQHLSTASAARRQRAEQQQRALAEAIPALLAAVVEHREHQYLKVAARRDGWSDTPESRAARYAARSRMTQAMDRLYMATDDAELLSTAQAAVDAATAVGDAPQDQFDAAGVRARETHTTLRTAAARHLHHR
ncbi:hypothetical protein RM780_09530 [Streptomyces sp. DSM 44917]|uniref:Protein kilB n=1 Tax=Streptomyces boetiae TaxID=3075541 RepID=A0ABU2L6K6_9ACTN|nr:hypothetical protein [Streptomyces sp. DSM 44917]MDT0307202.1 hypothetical protein [Streptomyces sp. DSM 44917]